MSINLKSGQRYKITNEASGLVVDLSGQRYAITNEESGLVTGTSPSGANNKSVIGWDFHGLDNQQVCSLRYFDNLPLIQPRYASVDHREAGRRPMDYPVSQEPEVPWI
jgi:hypothetical protein